MTEEKLACATLTVSNMLLLYFRWKKKHSKRRFWVNETLRQRDTPGYCSPLTQRLRSNDSEYYKQSMRMDQETFNKLLRILESRLAKQNTKWRKAISASDRLALTLRFLASGESQRTTSTDFCIGRATTCKIIAETCRVIWEHLMPDYLTCPNSIAEWKQIADEFDAKWNFPICVGALGVKQIVNEAATSLSKSSNTSDNQIMVICDAGYKFLCLAFGSPEIGSDEGMFASTEIARRLSDGRLILPNPELLGSGPAVPHVFVADEHFPLTSHIMKPYIDDGNSEKSEKIFNYRLHRACRVFDNAFGILTSRWRILRRPFRASVTNTYHYVKACICLHNFLLAEPSGIDVYCPSGYMDTDDWSSNVLLGEWRKDASPVLGLQDVERTCTDLYNPEAMQIREHFSKYFISNGAVPWQESIVSRFTHMYYNS